MSLKAFHVVFVALATILSAGFGVWEIRAWKVAGGGGALALAIAGFVIAAVLVVYGRWFLGKTKDVSYL